MADNSKIEWTDATWNVITGCKVKSPGCTNCYAMKLAGTRLRKHPSRAGLTQDSTAGPVWNGKVSFNEAWLKQPLEWKRARMIFVVAHGDLFYEAVPDEWIDSVFAVMLLAGRHTYQCLTKRPDRALAYLQRVRTRAGMERLESAARSIGYTFKHEGQFYVEMPVRRIWIGVSVEDQARADERRRFAEAIADLGWLTWVSYEPALGPVDWRGWEFARWMVSGGESGTDARPHHPDWHRATRDWCTAHGIAYHFKQWGEWAPAAANTGSGDGLMARVGKKAAGRILDGRTHDEFPCGVTPGPEPNTEA